MIRTGPMIGSGGNAGAAALTPRAALLLAGGSRRPELSVATERHVLELPLAGGTTVLDRLLSGLRETLPCTNDFVFKVMLSHSMELPDPITRKGVYFDRDERPLRGTAGAMADATQSYDDEDLLLVVHAAQVMLVNVSEVVHEMALLAAREHADVVILTEPDKSPGGFTLVRSGVLRQIPDVGYIDFKEQALPKLANEGRVVTLQYPKRTSIPVRTMRDYLEAVRVTSKGTAEISNPLQELDPGRAGSFLLIEDGAQVAEGARVIDSVVLRGATVESRATVIRSVVGTGAVARSGAGYVEKLVGREQRT